MTEHTTEIGEIDSKEAIVHVCELLLYLLEKNGNLNSATMFSENYSVAITKKNGTD